MPRQTGNYLILFQRIEEEFDLKTATSLNIRNFLGVDTSGRIGLADELSQANELLLEIETSDDEKAIRVIKTEILKQPIFREELIETADLKIQEILRDRKEGEIAESLARLSEFADKKKIKLSEKRIGRIEKFKNRERLTQTIRDEFGRFVTHD